MVYYSINDIIREKLYSIDTDQIMLFLDSLDEYEKNLYLRVIILDGYQVLRKSTSVLKKNKNLLRILSILDRLDFSKIVNVLDDNYDILYILFSYAKKFVKLPVIDRAILIGETYDNSMHSKLMSFNPLYLSDSAVYTVQKDIEYWNFYYNDYIDKFGVTMLPSFYNLLINLMKELKIKDQKLYDENFLSFIRGFYICYKYVSTFDKEIIKTDAKFCNIIEKNELCNIKKYLESMPNDFSYIISQYFVYENNLKNNIDLQDFINKRISERMIKKLELKKQ